MAVPGQRIGYFGPQGGGIVTPIPDQRIGYFGPAGGGIATLPTPGPVVNSLPTPEQAGNGISEGLAPPGITPPTSPNGDIETVIARLGIHPNSGLASAMRALHTALTAHLAAQAAQDHNRAQVGRGVTEPTTIFHNPTPNFAALSAHLAPVVHGLPNTTLPHLPATGHPTRPGPILL